MNLKLIEIKYKNRFKFFNTVFAEKTFSPIFHFIDQQDGTEYTIEAGLNVDLESVLENIIKDKRNLKINQILK
jgi:hypothetical protein